MHFSRLRRAAVVERLIRRYRHHMPVRLQTVLKCSRCKVLFNPIVDDAVSISLVCDLCRRRAEEAVDVDVFPDRLSDATHRCRVATVEDLGVHLRRDHGGDVRCPSFTHSGGSSSAGRSLIVRGRIRGCRDGQCNIS